MLLQQQETDAHEAALTRVSSDELARALAAIETRRQAEAERDADSIALGEAIRQLGLDLTPEELLDEVRAQRALAETEAGTRRRSARRRRRRRIAMSMVLAIVIYFCVAVWSGTPRGKRFFEHEPVTVSDVWRFGVTRDMTLETISAMNHGTPPEEALLGEIGPARHWQVAMVDGKPGVRVWTDGSVHDGKLRVYTDPFDARWDPNWNPEQVIDSRFHALTVPIERFASVHAPVTVKSSQYYGFDVMGVDILAK